MMYHKACTFDDKSTAWEILKTPSPRKCKALGRKVKGFDPAIWDPIKQSVVENGSYLKYTQGIEKDAEKLKERLLATGERELVEASRFDRVWGVGFTAEQCKEKWCEREMWGQNLLGKALVNVRRRIREEDEAQARAAGQEEVASEPNPEELIRRPPAA
jgi:ribA/ribD-fused uncharacterized protein